MSGSVSYTSVQQQVISNYQAWTPFVPMPENPPGPPNVNIGSGPTTNTFYRPWITTVLQSWQPADPLPTVPSNDALFATSGLPLSVDYTKFRINNLNVMQWWVPPDPPPTVPSQIGRVFTKSGPTPTPPAPKTTIVYPPQHVTQYGALPVVTVVNSPTGTIIPRAGLASTVTGTALAVAVGPINGGYILNPSTASAQGLGATENIYVDLVNPPGNSDATANGTTSLIAAGQSFTIPALDASVTVWVNAPSAGHHITVVVW